jgi:DMSO/TMAO reductase YedYZ molybdopterin-dependent catalytic subunit
MAKQQPRLPPGQFLTKRFPILTYGPTPEVDTEEWSLAVYGTGLEDKLEFTWDDFNALGQIEITRDFHCVTTWSRYDNAWAGVPVAAFWRKVAAALAVDADIGAVMLHCAGGYTTNLLLEDFLESENLFATHHDGAPLEAGHGGPIRFVCHHLYGWKSPKWITGVELLPADDRGFWEEHGYHIRGDPWREERYSYQEPK